MYRARKWLGCFLCACLSLCFGYLYSRNQAEASRAIKWETVTGVGDTVAITDHFINRAWNYYPQVTYHFPVGQKTYRNSSIATPEPVFDQQSKATALTGKYKVGGPTTVHYNPMAPAQACLQVGEMSPFTREFWLSLTFLILSIVLGLLAGFLPTPKKA